MRTVRLLLALAASATALAAPPAAPPAAVLLASDAKQPHVAIDAKGRGRAGHQRGPRIGVAKDGFVAVTAPLTFDDAEAARKYLTAELYVATSADGGAKWSAPLRVNEVEKQAPESLHAMAVAADGTVHVAWLDGAAVGNSTGSCGMSRLAAPLRGSSGQLEGAMAGAIGPEPKKSAPQRSSQTSAGP